MQTDLQRDDACILVRGVLSESIPMDDLTKYHLYQPSPRILSIVNSVPLIAEAERKTLRHLLVLELPGGAAWEQVCKDAADNSLPFHRFNTLPSHPGNENIPPPPSTAAAARVGLYNAKCQPGILDIINRARRMRKNHPLLKSAYLVTSAGDKWVDELRMWLLSEGWERVVIGRRDVWGKEWEVGEAVDLEVARRAGVYVGNGVSRTMAVLIQFSTFSSNLVLIRRKDGIHPDLTQFW